MKNSLVKTKESNNNSMDRLTRQKSKNTLFSSLGYVSKSKSIINAQISAGVYAKHKNSFQNDQRNKVNQ